MIYSFGLPLWSGCGGEEPADSGCIVSTDCPPGQICSAGVCVVDNGMGGPAPRPPTNMQPAPFDAGPGPISVDGAVTSCPEAVSCADVGAECGVIDDGCDGFVDCGDCVAPATCGGAGTPNQCGEGVANCTPSTCQSLGAQCGYVDDGCNNMLDCGGCTGGLTCGGGGTPNRCGSGTTCTPATCQGLGAQCGDLGDGCNGMLSCGGCPSGHYCNSNRCICTPKSCSDLNAECGDPEDECGGRLDCGSCDAPETCGGGGDDYQCGCTNTPQPPTGYRRFRTAVNNGTSDLISWRQKDDAIQFNSQGANFRVEATCRVYGSSDRRCSSAATASGTSRNLRLSNAAMAVPANAIIRGIEVEIAMKTNGTAPNIENISLIPGGSTEPSANRARQLNFSRSYKRFTFGGATDTWGRSWTVGELNHAGFRLNIQMSASVTSGQNSFCCQYSEPYVDAAQVRVYYDLCE